MMMKELMGKNVVYSDYTLSSVNYWLKFHDMYLEYNFQKIQHINKVLHNNIDTNDNTPRG